jgi:hypothetical protein
MRKVCATCKFAKSFDVGPGISGWEEGVECTNLGFAKYLDRLQKSDSYQREFKERGFINVFRVEAVAMDESEVCQFWKPKPKRKAKAK